MGCDVRKPVFGVSDKVRLKPAHSATETSQKFVILLPASLDMIFSNKRITKVLIGLHKLVFVFDVCKPSKTGFSQGGTYDHSIINLWDSVFE